MGLKDKLVEIVPDRTKRNLQIVGHDGSIWTLGALPIFIAFDFAGTNPPAPGTHSELFGICYHTSGIYGAGIVYYDTGTELLPVKTFVGMAITTTDEVVGEIALEPNSLYVAQSDTGTFQWTLKGGAGSFTPSTVPVDEPIINIINGTEEFCYGVNGDVMVDKVYYN